MNGAVPTLNLRRLALASLVPLAVMIAAMALKPLWRDEYWSLFFSDPTLSLSELFGGRWRDEVHPPLYYVLLHSWRALFDHPFLWRMLSPVLLGLSGWLILRSPAAEQNRRVVLTFLLVCLGSYWAIYFATEVRGYTLLFCLIAGSVALLPAWFSQDPLRWTVLSLWVLIGAAMALTHYFGALWIACLGFVTGLALLKDQRPKRFIIVGILTIIAILPLIAWLAWSLPMMDLSDEMTQRSFSEKFAVGFQQFSRGLFIKTALSNPLVTVLGVGGLVSAILMRDRLDAVLLYAVLLSVVIAFALQLFAVELIKERAFIVIMPALLFILAKHLASTTSRHARWIPVAAAIMPLLFIPEYFKNREGIPEMRDYLATHAQACAGEPVLAFYRQSFQTEFYPQATRFITEGWGKEPIFSADWVDAQTAEAPHSSACPIKAVGVLLNRKAEELEEIDQVLRQAGVEPDQLEALSFGKGRNRVWVDTDAQGTAP